MSRATHSSYFSLVSWSLTQLLQSLGTAIIFCALGFSACHAQSKPAVAARPQVASLSAALARSAQKQLHILYVHGMAANGKDDFDSWGLRKSLCEHLRDCIQSEGMIDGSIEYADQDEFQLHQPPPALAYLGQPVWATDANSTSSTEWDAAAPFVIHWKIARLNHPSIYVDEINWWPLVFSLKCRQIVHDDVLLVGPNTTYINRCALTAKDTDVPGRFKSFAWLDPQTAKDLLSKPMHGARVNRYLKDSLLDWGFSDAVLAIGPLRTYLLDGIRQLILKSVNVAPDGTRSDTLSLRPEQEFVIVTHSLGSYLVFSALDPNSTEATTPTATTGAVDFTNVLRHTSIVYMFANQLRLLELSDLNNSTNMSSHLETWSKLRNGYLMSQGALNQAKPRIVAWSDPSDLLSWNVPTLSSVAVDNYNPKNALHWFGLFENPTKAHDGYSQNKAVTQRLFSTTLE